MAFLRSALGLVLRLFAYFFELALSLFLIGLGLVVQAIGVDVHLGMFSWHGAGLAWTLMIAGIIGLASVLLAGSTLRWIFPLWSLFVLIMIIRGFFLSSYSFSGANQFQFAVSLAAGALIAFLGSLGVFRRRIGHS